MTTATNPGGRPQSYVGALEDRVVEMQAIALDLVPHDSREWQAHQSLISILAEATNAASVEDARHHAARAQALAIQMREADLEENRKHRAIIAIGRGMVPA